MGKKFDYLFDPEKPEYENACIYYRELEKYVGTPDEIELQEAFYNATSEHDRRSA